jgi:putative effector of murein hydrolase
MTVEFVIRTSPLWISLFLAFAVGLPIYSATGYGVPFEAFIISFLWIGAVVVQRSIKTCSALEVRPCIRSTMAILFNPVLVTSALVSAYFWTKAAVTHQHIDSVLGAFKHQDSWAAILAALATNPDPYTHIGAGDLATALLDAGIVSLGLKMFEYRRELWASFATVFLTSLVSATASVFFNVVVARAMGLGTPNALAFASRNVTIALGIPAVSNIGGSTTLMSALVVFSGMLFSMTGDLLFLWLRIRDRALSPTVTYHSDNEGLSGLGGSTDSKSTENGTNEHCMVIAAGVTVGINAAAMGTAHLIERDSRATAYSALSMTMFGIITVALTAVPAIAEVLMMLASR